MSFDSNQPRDDRGRWASVGGRLKTAAKVAGVAAAIGVGIAAASVAGGAAYGMARDAATRDAVRRAGGKTLGNLALRAMRVPPTHYESARQGAARVSGAMSSSVRGHAHKLRVAIGNQHRSSNRFTGPKIKRK